MPLLFMEEVVAERRKLLVDEGPFDVGEERFLELDSVEAKNR